MSRLTKFTLVSLIISALAAALFLTGIVDVSAVPGLYVALPLAAIFYGLFVICRALDKEVAAFDAEQRAHQAHVAPGEHPQNVEFLHAHDHHESIAA